MTRVGAWWRVALATLLALGVAPRWASAQSGLPDAIIESTRELTPTQRSELDAFARGAAEALSSGDPNRRGA
ncbi:MAG: hypothetical protein AAGK04_14860, partial [Planctomycetota bacterium]